MKTIWNAIKEWLPVVLFLGFVLTMVILGLAYEFGKAIAVWKYITS